MNPLAMRATVLFALAATIPVALATVVWLSISRSGDAVQQANVDLARRGLDELDTRRLATVTRLCRDDLAMDQLLEERGGEAESTVDYDRLFAAAASASGLDVLWVVDSVDATILARGHRQGLLRDGSPLLALAAESVEGPVLFLVGPNDSQRFLVRSCTITRSGARISVFGGHRISTLRELDEQHIRVVGSAGKGDIELFGLEDPEGVAQAVVVWRADTDGSQLPWLLWVGCVLALAAGLGLVFGGYLGRWLQSSADELAEAAARVGRGDFETTLREDTRTAFPATATAFGRMTRELRDAQDQLRQTERVAAWKDIARSLAHELKNPLSPIRLSIETLRKAHARSPEDFDAMFEESTKTILEEVERLRHIVDEFSEFARLPAPKLRRTDLRETVSQAVALHRQALAPVEWQSPNAPVMADVDPDQMMQVLHNVIQNACEAAFEAHPESGARVALSIDRDSESVRVHIDDNGSGIPEENAQAVFDPYFTTKSGGTGLGLAISHRIVTEHGGTLSALHTESGTRMTLRLPLAPDG